MPRDLTQPLIVFLRPPPGMRLHTPGTDPNAHTAAHTVTKATKHARLLDYGPDSGGNPRWAAADDFHWTGYWTTPKDAVEALRRLRIMNQPRIEACGRQQARDAIQRVAAAGLQALAPEVAGAIWAIQAAVGGKEGGQK